MNLVTEKIEISGLQAGTLKALKKIGQSNGKSAEEYALIIIEAEVLSQQSFDFMLQPVRQDFVTSEMTEVELDIYVKDLARETGVSIIPRA